MPDWIETLASSVSRVYSAATDTVPNENMSRALSSKASVNHEIDTALEKAQQMVDTVIEVCRHRKERLDGPNVCIFAPSNGYVSHGNQGVCG